ncbi:MAG TPA: hypothetical protein VKX24_02495 [Acidimicrobiia bacterium]|nr:hypothetical protein [Acidimicrobiia bacterium]
MDPLSPLSLFGPVRAVPPVAAGGARSGVSASPWRAPELPQRRVGVQFDHRSDGVEMMTAIDMRTGVVISQTPAPQVLAVVDSIMAAIRQREV